MKGNKTIATLLTVVGMGLVIAQSVLADFTINPTAGTLNWDSVVGANYRIMQHSDITGSWWTSSGDIAATPPNNSWPITIVGQQLYRLQMETSPGVFEDVYDIVGYIKKSYSAGEVDIIIPQFLSDNPNQINMNDVFSGMSDQSVVYPWIGAVYIEYTYFLNFGWFDGGFIPSDPLLDLGKAVWFIDPGPNNTIVMSGKAPSAPSITIPLVAGFNLIGNPYPAEMTLGDISISVLSDQDKVFLWNGTSYVDYTYYAGFGWYDSFFVQSDHVPVAVGQGFWLRTAVGGNLTFNKPY